MIKIFYRQTKQRKKSNWNMHIFEFRITIRVGTKLRCCIRVGVK